MLRCKLLIVSMMIAIALLIGAIGVSTRVFVGHFDDIELAQTIERAAQVDRALQADLDQLALSNRDYAEWDDAQAYILGREPGFIAANFSVDSLRGMNVDVVAIMNADGTEKYSASLAASGKELTSPAARELINTFGRLHLEERSLRKLNSTRRIIRSSQGLVAFSAIEIRRSDKSGPTGAVMFFARLLRAEVIERVRQTSRLPAELTVISGSPAKLVDEDTSPVGTWLSDDALSHPLHAYITGPNSVVGLALVRDVTGQPVAYFSTSHEREVGRLGRHMTWELMGTLAALLIVSAGALLFLMLRLQRSWHERAALESRHRNILTYLKESVALADPGSGQIIDANDALLRTLGYAREDLPSLNLHNIYVDLPHPLEGGVPAMERFLRKRDGHLQEEEVTITEVIENERRLVCVVGRDVTQRKQAELALQQNQSQLAHLLEHDPLTGLPNRTYLDTHLPGLLQYAGERQQSIALIAIDLDRFKNVNDSGGQSYGDEVLRVISKRLRATVTPHDVVVRTGADEFIIIVLDLSDDPTRRKLAERLCTAIREPVVIGNLHTSLTASVGIAIYPLDATDGETLVKHAGIAVREAKERGRDCYLQFSREMVVQVSEHLSLEKAFRRALDEDQIYVEYQPVVDLQTGLLVSFEALARWRDPELGVVSPGRFIPVAEKSGLIVAMTERLVRKVVTQLDHWQRAGLLLAPVAVNVAAVQFERTEFPIFVQETMLEHKLDPRWLSFEVTESAWMQNSSKHVVMIDSLRHAGSRIYIDDFGTGFSNLSYLKTLPIDAVKIDQGFIRGIEADASDEAIVGGIVAMARQLGLATVAEGIETDAQAQKLRALGCLYGQGYFFSRPMPADKCRTLLQQLAEAQRVTETLTMKAFRRLAS